MVKALADRLAEAFAEYLHARARRDWGYGADETLSNEELIDETYRGIRPAFGYPACPDHTEKATLFALLDAGEVGMALTESFAMMPPASVSGLYLAHPDARYFMVGRIGRDQVEDYAARKGMTRRGGRALAGPEPRLRPGLRPRRRRLTPDDSGVSDDSGVARPRLRSRHHSGVGLRGVDGAESSVYSFIRLDGCVAATTVTAAILDQLAVLSDAIRVRVLAVLEAHELTVSELCDVLRLPQSTVSRHLKTLADGGWVTSRREATSRLYTVDAAALPDSAKGLWQVVRGQVGSAPDAAADARRLARVLDARRAASQAFFASAAGEWGRLRDELFGASTPAKALLGLLDPDWVVADLGCGAGHVSSLVAPFVRRVIGVDASAAMLAAAEDARPRPRRPAPGHARSAAHRRRRG